MPKFGRLCCSAILAALRKGATHRLAATTAGIDPRTLKTWLANGRANLLLLDQHDAGDWPADQPPPELDKFGRFTLEVYAAEGEPELAAVESWTKAARKDWRAASDWLRRRRPAEYSEVAQIRRVAIDDEGRVQQADSPEEALLDKFDQALARLEALDGPDEVDEEAEDDCLPE